MLLTLRPKPLSGQVLTFFILTRVFTSGAIRGGRPFPYGFYL